MKKLLLCFSCIMVIVLLSGCSMDNTPTKKVENFLDSYRNQDENVLTQLNEMVDSDTLMNDDQKTTYTDIMKKQYEDLTYEIKDEVINGDTATVTAEIEVYDYYKINQEAQDYYNSNPDEFSDDTTNDNNDSNNNDDTNIDNVPNTNEEQQNNDSDNQNTPITYQSQNMNQATTSLPYTGTSSIIIGFIILLSISMVVSIIRYKQFKDVK